MPPSSEFRNGCSYVRIVEVLKEMESEHSAQADGHITVTAEVKEDLHGVGNGTQPTEHHRNRDAVLHSGEGLIRKNSKTIGKQHFFSEAHHKTGKSIEKVVNGLSAVFDLIGNRFIPDDRSGNQLREERNVQTYIQQVCLNFSFLTVNIKHIGHALKGEERYADGKHNIGNLQTAGNNRINHIACESKILKHKQQTQMEYNIQANESLAEAVPLAVFADQQTKKPVKDN